VAWLGFEASGDQFQEGFDAYTAVEKLNHLLQRESGAFSCGCQLSDRSYQSGSRHNSYRSWVLDEFSLKALRRSVTRVTVWRKSFDSCLAVVVTEVYGRPDETEIERQLSPHLVCIPLRYSSEALDGILAGLRTLKGRL